MSLQLIWTKHITILGNKHIQSYDSITNIQNIPHDSILLSFISALTCNSASKWIR